MITRNDCLELDQVDPMAATRDQFCLDAGLIYLDGNSLGAQPKDAAEKLETTITKEWRSGLIRSWGAAGWYTMPGDLGDRIGNLIGAGPGQMVVCDTTSINIYKALRAAMHMRNDRHVIVSETASFPTDLYMIEGAMKAKPGTYSTRLLANADDDIADLIDEDVAVILLSNVDYKTGKLHDMERVTKLAHNAGALIIWDLCHSAGVLPMDLDGINADFAVGCTYKYLNGGPGSPAYIYVANRHQEVATQPLSGWMGHASPFAFDPAYTPATGINRFLCGTQPVLSMKGVEISLDLFDTMDIQSIRAKSQKMTQLFIDLVAQHPSCKALKLVSPTDPLKRGSHVSFEFENGYPVIKAMIEKGVIGDFRAPSIMRFGFAPYYLGFADIFDAVEIMADCIDKRVWAKPRYRELDVIT
ncbi:kynureninase [Sulfitobacter sp. F26204]|uniref:kynureninase n=1 Tax=Sulfitobacter sp. F26204 TaxID=2996014 RepID=UPI00225E1FE7|nr:kynureninase [Sulfitobacter sp. F26204]MCX7561743.1 kynureninase [Sulfitobacter sp. F26204]